jgi:hypothetical protein
MLFTRQWYDKLIVCAFALGLFLYASYRPQFRLREQMPPEFVADTPSSHDQKQGAEQRIAREYWDCAVKEIQWRYAYGSALPEQPPPQFTIESASASVGAGNPAIREHYWQKLRAVWFLPSIWGQTYRWDFSWMRNPIKGAAEWVQGIGRRYFNLM